jgi:hypothetical protein
MLKPLQKFSDVDGDGFGHSCSPHPNGNYVLYKDVQIREQVFIDTLRKTIENINSYPSEVINEIAPVWYWDVKSLLTEVKNEKK